MRKMLDHRANIEAHCLAVASATTPIVGVRLDDVKWLISVIVSAFGSLVALYIFAANARRQSEAIRRYEVAARRPVEPRSVDPLPYLDD
jgi:hypothetical protein